MLRVVVCVSGGGTNLQAILDAIAGGSLPDTEIVLVLSNNKNAYALARAKKAGVPTAVVSRADYADASLFEQALLETVDAAGPDLIVLAGFLVTIPRAMVEAYRMRIINVHPSLIPSFCGTGFYGLKVHEKALERGVRVSGATVHFVDEGTDTGPIILQKPVMIRDDDTPETLQRRIMEQAEWKIMPMAIDLIANGKVKVNDHKVIIDGYDELVI